jgi:hypothetical protein
MHIQTIRILLNADNDKIATSSFLTKLTTPVSVSYYLHKNNDLLDWLSAPTFAVREWTTNISGEYSGQIDNIREERAMALFVSLESTFSDLVRQSNIEDKSKTLSPLARLQNIKIAVENARLM